DAAARFAESLPPAQRHSPRDLELVHVDGDQLAERTGRAWKLLAFVLVSECRQPHGLPRRWWLYRARRVAGHEVAGVRRRRTHTQPVLHVDEVIAELRRVRPSAPVRTAGRARPENRRAIRPRKRIKPLADRIDLVPDRLAMRLHARHVIRNL